MTAVVLTVQADAQAARADALAARSEVQLHATGTGAGLAYGEATAAA